MKTPLIVIAATLLASPPAVAQEWFGPGYFNNWAFNNQAAEMLRRSQKRIFRGDAGRTLRRAQKPSVVPSTPVAADGEQVRQIAGQLAAGFPAAEREKATKIFVDLHGRYGQLERQLGVRGGDPAGATAALIAASYMAYADADINDGDFRQLYAQLKGLAGSAAPEARRDVAEAQVTMAILATYLASTREALKVRPDTRRSAELRRAGGSYLRELLGVDPARVRLGANGLVLA